MLSKPDYFKELKPIMREGSTNVGRLLLRLAYCTVNGQGYNYKTHVGSTPGETVQSNCSP